jgi:two-component system, chemotaxis family, protein-glutamate methylesterase/glutaminase
MAAQRMVVIGASAGGVETLIALVSRLPHDFPASVFVVLHVPAHGTSVLPQILCKHGPLPAIHPRDGQPIQPGQIYVAPPDHHLLVKAGHVRVTRGPAENSHRPAVDPLFRTAAVSHGPAVIGVVLSGTLDDGTAGLGAIKQRGGVAIVQDPEEALFKGMPRSAIDNVAVDHVLPVAEIAPLLARLAHEAPAGRSLDLVPNEMEMEADVAEMEPDAMTSDQRPGSPAGFGCPSCGGALWELHEGNLVHFRCRVGHAWSPESLLSEQSGALEGAMWTALRALEEKAALTRRLAERAGHRGHALARRQFERQLREVEQQAELIRQVLANTGATVAEEPDGRFAARAE